MIVRCGSITSAPKASPGCSGDGEAGSSFGGVAGGICSLRAGGEDKRNDNRCRKACARHQDSPSFRRGDPGDSHHLIHSIMRLWPFCVYSPYKPGETRAKAKTVAEFMGALANQPYVKMNGIGNAIVVVDLRRHVAKISADEAG